MEDEDDTDETLTSLLNEIAFLNQQLNDDSVSLAELPSSLDTEFPGDARGLLSVSFLLGTEQLSRLATWELV